jgi:putative ABC transport system substrate-binding protein
LEIDFLRQNSLYNSKARIHLGMWEFDPSQDWQVHSAFGSSIMLMIQAMALRFGMVTRRRFITVLSGVATWSVAARAQQPIPVVGLLGATPLDEQLRTDSFINRLHQLGWVEGRTIAIESRWAEGRPDRFAEIAAEFVRLKAAVIVTAGAGPVSAVRRVTQVIPIVFAIASDPVGTGLVSTLARPGGNVTGLSYMGTDLAAKRLELLRGILTGLRRIAVMAHKGAPGAMLELRAALVSAERFGLEAVPLEIPAAGEFGPEIAKLKARVDALYVCADPLVNANRVAIVASAHSAELPTVFGERENALVGGLMSYGPNVADMYRRAAEIVDKILRGAKPAEIPVEQPTKFEFVLNLKTAKALRLDVPTHLQQLADEVIE